MEQEHIRIAEIFGPTVQGEGALIGEPTVFVRTGGCDYRCSWCDSLHAVDSQFRHAWKPMHAQDVIEKIEALSKGEPLMVTLSGGNPAIQPLGDLIMLGKEKGYRFALETQGSVSKDWFSSLDMLVLSPKPPSSGEQVDWQMFDTCLEQAGDKPSIVLKIVIFDEADYAFARETASKYPKLPIYLQPGNHTPPTLEGDEAIDMDGIIDRYQWLVERVLEDKWYAAKVLPQLHVLIWGNKRGV